MAGDSATVVEKMMAMPKWYSTETIVYRCPVCSGDWAVRAKEMEERNGEDGIH